MRLSRDELLLIATATQSPTELARVIVSAILGKRDLDFQIERSGRDFIVILRELHGEQIMGEHVMPIVWSTLDEARRYAVVSVYVEQLLEAHARWAARRLVVVALDVRHHTETTQ